MRITTVRSAMAGMAVASLLLAGCASDNGSESNGAAEAPASAAPSTPAGNGIADLEPAAIVGKAKAALAEAKSYRFEGIVHSFGESTTQLLGKTTTIDFEIRGSDVLGTLADDKSTIKMLRIGNKAYIRPDYAFWKANIGERRAKTVMTAIKGRWVAVPPKDEDFDAAFSFADAGQLLDVADTYTKGDIQTIDGKRAIAIKETGSDPGTLFIAVDGPPYPLRYDGGVQRGGTQSLSDFGATFSDLKIPPASNVIDLAKLAD